MTGLTLRQAIGLTIKHPQTARCWYKLWRKHVDTRKSERRHRNYNFYFGIPSNPWIREKFFDFYLWLHGKDNLDHWHDEVWDHLGPIDTLGSSGAYGRWTSSYSDELQFNCSLHCGPLMLTLHNDNQKYMVLYWMKRRSWK